MRYQTAPLPVAKRATGIEPALRAWKARVQPQHFARQGSALMILPRPGGTGEAPSQLAPAAAAPGGTIPGRPWWGESGALTIVPPPAGRSARETAASVIVAVPPTLSAITARQPLASIISAGAKYWPPALLTRTSSRPSRAS